MSLKIKLLETSFEKIKPRAIEFSDRFYQILFQRHPALKGMFRHVSLELQQKKLIASLGLIVENLRNPDELTLALKSLGARHLEVGTFAEHYPLVGSALLKALAEYLPEDWNPELEQAWSQAYHLISETMLEGAQNPELYLRGELTFYDWLDLYGESSPAIREMISAATHFQYGNQE
jgi:hemoglobin-like flavoprotein